METDISKASVTDMNGTVTNFSVSNVTLDEAGMVKETWYDFPDSDKYLKYYKTIPELKKAVDALATWVTSKGYDTNPYHSVILDHLIGWGEDSASSIFWNLQVQKKIFGDAFAEIIRDDKGTILNIKPLYPGNMRVVVNGQGIITRYEQRTNVPTAPKKFSPDKILHLVNDRVANEIHGTSVIQACQWVIDARNESMADWRRILHRSTIRVLYVPIDDNPMMAKVKTQYQTAINKGEVVVVPAKPGEAQFQDLDAPPIDAFLRWIQYLEGFFYQAVGIPRVIATSENYTEAASKVGYLTFEPIYTREQTELEYDLWNQCQIKLTFNRPPSLMDTMQQSEAKNTSQTGFQQGDLNPNVKP